MATYPVPKPEPRDRAAKLRAQMEKRRERRTESVKRSKQTREETLREVIAEDPGFSLLEQGGPLPTTNPERLKRLREAQYAEASGYHKWVMEQPCAACGSFDPEVRSDPAHVGQTKGAGAKADKVLSLCRMCHLFEGEHRNEFNALFEERHKVTPEEMAAARHERYHRDHANV